MSESDERVLDAESWKQEAEAVIGDVKEHVKFITISEKLINTNQKIYFNLETLEGKQFSVELSALGFRLIGNKYDTVNVKEPSFSDCFETPYSLLSQISPGFCESFGKALAQKLENLQQ